MAAFVRLFHFNLFDLHSMKLGKMSEVPGKWIPGGCVLVVRQKPVVFKKLIMPSNKTCRVRTHRMCRQGTPVDGWNKHELFSITRSGQYGAKFRDVAHGQNEGWKCDQAIVLNATFAMTALLILLVANVTSSMNISGNIS